MVRMVRPWLLILLSRWAVPLAEATASAGRGPFGGAARSEADVGREQECEHASIGFEALQTASALSKPRHMLKRDAGGTERSQLSGVEGNPYVPGPNIYLADLVDLDNYWGYCLDIAGSPPHPQCDSIQGHTCKSDGADTQFRYDPDTGSIVSQNFNGICNPMYDGEQDGRIWQADLNNTRGGCLRVAGSLEAGTQLVMVECRAPDSLQKFRYTPSRQFAVVNTSLCLVLGQERAEQDGFSSRTAELQDCASWPAELSTWEVITSTHEKYYPESSPSMAWIGVNSEQARGDPLPL
ncbi:unnamed protein product [Prorocentrum cordatum]|uniref:Ricin B lectin domain-containing protein n=1 Tax=Prorocentrum cordatum TaxID=2364126 RepID=A0ABN9S2S6_9DINO|nr:unnamed protein product [Polarella glacialis]